ncbi:STAS domain-containing protein [Massilia sp. CFBP9026]|uniref:STAS domain-containing protein n=1 Tax=Massilia sp. CFBP9026 TaxID=3096536 RepID=UPI002A6B81E1|nr:STAS domain-containing protein [Massilia sp. CFBP9026]MDY0963483.1 STAS domain-containing protein [Massilia sp. CFBP9026]
MGLFSFLKRKNDDAGVRDWPPPESRLRGEPSRLDTEAERERQREIARATAAKIDEIELAFASDMFDDEPAWGSGVRRPASSVAHPEQDIPPQTAAPASAPAIDESAILYANGQPDAAEQLLRACLPTLGRAERLPWWMLFDLYQADGREDAFESIAIDYASHFETSPPAWKPLPAALDAARPGPGLAAVEAFGPTVDASVAARLTRVLDATAPVVRLDFGRVTAIDADGAACLLAALQTLRLQQTGGRELVLAGADTLLDTLRPMLVIGQRATSPAPWLLLLELLLLTHCEKQFEEAAMDYCVTYEVSPPSFEAPLRVSTAAPAPGHGDRFMLPAVVSGPDGALLAAIDAYAQERETLVLDCSRLARIDYAGAGSLLARLDAHGAAGRTVELRELNHLVATLLRLLGAGDGVRLYPHRY